LELFSPDEICVAFLKLQTIVNSNAIYIVQKKKKDDRLPSSTSETTYSLTIFSKSISMIKVFK
jgi:hypothetical protein